MLLRRAIHSLRRRSGIFMANNSVLSSGKFAAETRVALAAVLKASHLTSDVFNTLVKDKTDTAVKDDKSPVTGEF
jgi:hypothetical protein